MRGETLGPQRDTTAKVFAKMSSLIKNESQKCERISYRPSSACKRSQLAIRRWKLRPVGCFLEVKLFRFQGKNSCKGHQKRVEPTAKFDSARDNSPGLDTARIDSLRALFDLVVGGS